MAWQVEPSFPFIPVYGPANIPYGNSFLTVGGHFGGENAEYVDYVYTVVP